MTVSNKLMCPFCYSDIKVQTLDREKVTEILVDYEKDVMDKSLSGVIDKLCKLIVQDKEPK